MSAGDRIGYACTGCDATFLYADYEENWFALRSARHHVADDHNMSNAVESLYD